MKPPKCRLCGHEHWSREPHVFRDATNEVNSATNTAATNIPAVTAHERKVLKKLEETVERVAKSDDELRKRLGLTPNRRKREDYNAYQKELMRKRRLALKERKPA